MLRLGRAFTASTCRRTVAHVRAITGEASSPYDVAIVGAGIVGSALACRIGA